jgi:hypothetical protein
MAPKFMMFYLEATVGPRIGNPYEMRHLAAKSSDSMLMNLPHLANVASGEYQAGDVQIHTCKLLCSIVQVLITLLFYFISD